MCGIVGTIAVNGATAPSLRVDRLQHRGPDGAGALRLSLSWGSVFLGQTRLAVVGGEDVPAPYDFRESCGVVLVFNGEIYNWAELRKSLKNETWETACDAEVIAHAWREHGADMLHLFNGMFAFALVDLRTSEVFLARDRAGEKPLFYSLQGDVLHFSSEVQGLGIPLEEDRAPAEVACLEFDCLTDTPFRGVRRLLPGSSLRVLYPFGVSQRQWWTLPQETDESMSWAHAVEETQALLISATSLRAASEVPITTLVSGGLDSALVHAISGHPEVYCATFPEEGMDLLPEAQLAAGAARVRGITFTLEEAQGSLDRIAEHLGTPATWSALTYWFLARAIKQDGFRVVLSGDGADELFAGYSRYRVLYWLNRMEWDRNLSGYMPTVKTALELPDQPWETVIARMLDRSPGKTQQGIARDLLTRFGGKGDPIQQMSRVEFHTTMQVNLRMADRMFAAFGLENRSVFLDHRLLELSARMPTRHKVHVAESKAVLRQVARNLGVPDALIDTKTKRGLPCPWNAWRGINTGTRGVWDRGDFKEAMNAAWRRVNGFDAVQEVAG